MYADGYGRIREMLASATIQPERERPDGRERTGSGVRGGAPTSHPRMRQGITRGMPPPGQALTGR